MTQQIEKLLKNANEAFALGDYAQAIELYRKLIRQDNSVIEAHLNMGRAVNRLFRKLECTEKIEEIAYMYLEMKDRAAFSLFYNLYKFQLKTLGHPTSSVVNGLISFYENRGDLDSALLNCPTLKEAFLREGKADLAADVDNRVKRNLQAQHRQEIDEIAAGNHRDA